jgi:hypothetical protein
MFAELNIYEGTDGVDYFLLGSHPTENKYIFLDMGRNECVFSDNEGKVNDNLKIKDNPNIEYINISAALLKQILSYVDQKKFNDVPANECFAELLFELSAFIAHFCLNITERMEKTENKEKEFKKLLSLFIETLFMVSNELVKS